MKLGLFAVVGAVASLACAPAFAATFNETSGFGDPTSGFGECKSLSNSTAFATGTVLGAANLVDNTCTGYFNVDIDTSAKTITLTSAQYGNYEDGLLDISNILGTTVTGVSTVSYSGLFDPNFYGNPSLYGGVPAPQVSFTANSISILFTTYGQAPPQFTYAGTPGTAVFSYTTAGVPEPATWAMIIGGFGMAGAALRRRRHALAAV